MIQKIACNDSLSLYFNCFNSDGSLAILDFQRSPHLRYFIIFVDKIIILVIVSITLHLSKYPERELSVGSQES